MTIFFIILSVIARFASLITIYKAGKWWFDGNYSNDSITRKIICSALCIVLVFVNIGMWNSLT